ncbi:sensor histidine kinase [Allonocardiopsis opalescens]|uniref:sensor histidine kinase n=1 Tax=Allonocardiopsis opalescens TaxID=1144618 RepID=UPI001474BF45|nr:histidine kinase [Allonocardiopsis opalescens]
MRRWGWLERRLWSGRLSVGGLLWAGGHVLLGLLLWGLGLYSRLPWAVGPDWALLLPLLGVCAGIALRSGRTGWAFAVASVSAAADLLVAGPFLGTWIAYTDVLYATAALGGRRLAYGVTGAFLAVVVAVSTAWLVYSGSLVEALQVVAILALFTLTPLQTGLTVRQYRERADLERRRAGEVARLAELDHRNAMAAERARMARELHDVVANRLSAVAVQSTGALALPDFDPERVRGVLEVVRRNSVQGLAEMRDIIGVLRSGEDVDGDGLVAPSLGEVGALADTARAAGLEVELAVRGEAGELPPAVELAGYRIVQESLTNALRYAEPRRAEVVLEYRGDALAVRVGNPAGERRDGPPVPGGGVGVAGMRERASVLGGTLAAGRGAAPPGGSGAGDGGAEAWWWVRAELPLRGRVG